MTELLQNFGVADKDIQKLGLSRILNFWSDNWCEKCGLGSSVELLIEERMSVGIDQGCSLSGVPIELSRDSRIMAKIPPSIVPIIRPIKAFNNLGV